MTNNEFNHFMEVIRKVLYKEAEVKDLSLLKQLESESNNLCHTVEVTMLQIQENKRTEFSEKFRQLLQICGGLKKMAYTYLIKKEDQNE